MNAVGPTLRSYCLLAAPAFTRCSADRLLVGGLQQGRCLASGGAASLVAIKDLRERSESPISEVKAALVEAGWDFGVQRIIFATSNYFCSYK